MEHETVKYSDIMNKETNPTTRLDAGFFIEKCYDGAECDNCAEHVESVDENGICSECSEAFKEFEDFDPELKNDQD